MRLQKATVIAIVGLSFLFISRMTATFFMDIFSNHFIALTNAILLLVAMFAVLYFCFIFLQDFVPGWSPAIKSATILLIISVLIMIALHSKLLLGIILPYNYYFFHEHYIFEPVAAWITAVLSLIFFVVFYRVYNGSVKLKKAVLLAVAGSAAGLIVRTLTTLRSTLYQDIRDLNAYHTILITAGFFLVIFSFFTMIYFLVIFYKHQKKVF